MSTIDSAFIGAVLQDQVPQMVQSVITRRKSLITRLLNNFQRPVRNAKGPVWQVEIEGNETADAFAESGPYPNGDRTSEVEARLGWARYAGTIRFTEQALLEWQAGSDQSKIASYLDRQSLSAVERMFDRMENDALTNDPDSGGSSDRLVGLDAIFADANIYATIDRATQALWRAYENTAGGAISKTILDDMSDTLMQTRGGNWTAIYCNKANARAISEFTGSTSVAQRVVIVDPANPTPAGIGYSDDDPSAPYCYYDGKPVYVIPTMANSRVLMVDEADLFIEVFKPLSVSPIQQLQNSPNFVSNITMYLQMGHENPYKGCAFATGITV